LSALAKEKKQISVVIPAFNEEAFIRSTLKCLERQTLPRNAYEIIVVDGGSTDHTVEIASEFADIVLLQRSKFVGGARNDGVRVASADIIATTDADILVPRNWLERIISDFKRKDVVAVYGPIEPIEQRMKYKIMLELFNKLSHFANKTHIFYTTVGANTAFRRDAFLKVGGYDEIPANDDYGIAKKLKKEGRILYDARLKVKFSMRRMEKFGVSRALLLWAENAWAAKRGKTPKVAYTRQNYSQQNAKQRTK